VNPQWHDEFVALCALFPSGELTEEEWALLQVHLAYCDSCRVAFEEYRQIASEVIPVLASSAAAEQERHFEARSFSIEAAEQRLMNRLASMQNPRASPSRSKGPWLPIVGVIAACGTLVAGLIGFHRYQSQPSPVAHTNIVAPPASTTAPAATVSDQGDLQSQLTRSQEKVSGLEQRLKDAEERYRQSNSSEATIRQQLESETAERAQISEERDSLRQQLASAQSDVESLRTKASAAEAVASQHTMRIAALEGKLREVDVSLDEKDKMLELDKEFLAHDREIRDLIGARNLYITDIYDVAQNGQTNKPFGRIFYTKDKSLVFYGYDLDKQPGLKQSVTFQAWGSGDNKQNVSLGLFYQDDTHKRWILRFNDTKTLARLNMVFVTAEPQGGSTKPTGKPLLLAYLQMQPNHP
jgi:hypothetical protein